MKHVLATVVIVLAMIAGLALPIGDIVHSAGPVLQRPFEPGQGDYPRPADAERLAEQNDGKAGGCLPSVA